MEGKVYVFIKGL